MNKNPELLRNKSQLIDLAKEIEDLCLAESKPELIFNKLNQMESLLQSNHINEDLAISAQISLYPLKQAVINQSIHETIQIFRDFGLEVIPGAMSTVIAGSEELIWRAVQNAFRVATKHGETVMTLTISNACPWEKPG